MQYNPPMHKSIPLLLLLTLLLSACGTSAAPTQTQPLNTNAPDTPTSIPNTPSLTGQGPTHTTAPPTPTASPIPPTPTPDMNIYAVIDGFTGYLIGGSQNGVWLSADMTASNILNGEEYRLFNSTEYLGISIGTNAETIENGPCTRNYTVSLDPKPDYVPLIEIAGNWDVLPRSTTRLAPAVVYKEAIEKLLIQQGITNPEVEIINKLKVDLEGDGVDEVLINAVHMASGAILPPVSVGDYSLIVLRKIVNGEVATIPLVLDVYLEANDLAYPTIHTIGGVYDLNGDGRLDIFVKGRRWEGQSMSIFDIKGETANLVLMTGCNQ